jgi:hypothetical protein
MKIHITKIDAAERQLKEAVTLFFEDRDPVSIHTLIGAALGILEDYMSEDEVCELGLLLNYSTIRVEDKNRKFLINKVFENRNFFKHADKDLGNGKESIEFETELNRLYLFEALRCYDYMFKKKNIRSSYPFEFKLFYIYNINEYPELFKEGVKESFGGIENNYVFPENIEWNDYIKVLNKYYNR